MIDKLNFFMYFNCCYYGTYQYEVKKKKNILTQYGNDHVILKKRKGQDVVRWIKAIECDL